MGIQTGIPDGFLKQRGILEEMDELFGIVIPAERKDTGAGATGKNDGIHTGST